MEGIEDGAAVLKEVKTKISWVANKGVKGIKITKGEAAIIEERDKEQKDNIKRELDKHKEFTTRIGGKTNLKGDGVIAKLEQNPDLNSKFTAQEKPQPNIYHELKGRTQGYIYRRNGG